MRIVGESGPVVLLLPGGAEAVEGFFPGLVEGLVADPGCRVLLHDRPGVGTNAGEARLEDAADALHATIAAAGVGPVIAIGQSLGGAVALLLATAHPDDVAGLVLLDATPINDPGLADMVETRATQTVRIGRVPLVGAALHGLLCLTSARSARRHRVSDEARAAYARMSALDLAQLERAVVGLGELGAAFDEAAIPDVPAAVVTADRKPADVIRAAHQRLADRLGVPLRTWPGAEHAVHLTHEREVLEVCRDVARRVAAA